MAGTAYRWGRPAVPVVLALMLAGCQSGGGTAAQAPAASSAPAAPAPATTTAAAPPAAPETTTTSAAPPPAPATSDPVGAPPAPSVFNNHADGTYACTGGNVTINGSGSTLHLVGQCSLVVVNGAGSHVEIDASARIIVNGASADVIYHSNAQVIVNGLRATAHRV